MTIFTDEEGLKYTTQILDSQPLTEEELVDALNELTAMKVGHEMFLAWERDEIIPKWVEGEVVWGVNPSYVPGAESQ